MSPASPPSYRLLPLALAALLAAKRAAEQVRSALAGARPAPQNLALSAVLMTPATPASHTFSWLWPAAGVLLLVVWQVVACWMWPFKVCRRCDGTGRRPAAFGGSAFRTCGRCSGSGKRVRTGRRMVDQFREVRRRAQ